MPGSLLAFRLRVEGSWYLAEDYAFCARARQCGIAIMADTSIRLWHVGTYRYGWEDAGSDKERFATYNYFFTPSAAKTAEAPLSPALEQPELG